VMATLVREEQGFYEKDWPLSATRNAAQEHTNTLSETEPAAVVKNSTAIRTPRRTSAAEADSSTTDAVPHHRPTPKIVWAMSISSLALLMVVAVAFYMRSRSAAAKQEQYQGPPAVRPPSPRIVITQH